MSQRDRPRDRRRARQEQPRHRQNLIERKEKDRILAGIRPWNCSSCAILEPSRKGEGLAALRTLPE